MITIIKISYIYKMVIFERLDAKFELFCDFPETGINFERGTLLIAQFKLTLDLLVSWLVSTILHKTTHKIVRFIYSKCCCFLRQRQRMCHVNSYTPTICTKISEDQTGE